MGKSDFEEWFYEQYPSAKVGRPTVDIEREIYECKSKLAELEIEAWKQHLNEARYDAALYAWHSREK